MSGKRRKKTTKAKKIKRAVKFAKPKLVLQKFERNPVIQPKHENKWESKAAFNPAALYEDGKVHLLYRAIGDSDVSVLGYAASHDGFNIHERFSHPAYVPRESFEGAIAKRFGKPGGFYTSGGGVCGGCEDPRLTRIGNTIYMTYVAYDGWNEPRAALSSISVGDFLSRNWNWAQPALISPPGVVDKNAAILPEKINGKYVIFHRVFPDILIDFVDDLDFDGKTKWLKRDGDLKIKPRPEHWDSRKIGVGAPPIKTDYGWLLIYQAVGNQDPGRYKIGAMLLDLKNPGKIIARSKQPVLEPDEWYENDGWKSGVVYPCGTAVIDGQLLVYYGGADAVVCVASADLEEFIRGLLADKTPKLARKKL